MQCEKLSAISFFCLKIYDTTSAEFSGVDWWKLWERFWLMSVLPICGNLFSRLLALHPAYVWWLVVGGKEVRAEIIASSCLNLKNLFHLIKKSRGFRLFEARPYIISNSNNHECKWCPYSRGSELRHQFWLLFSCVGHFLELRVDVWKIATSHN